MTTGLDASTNLALTWIEWYAAIASIYGLPVLIWAIPEYLHETGSWPSWTTRIGKALGLAAFVVGMTYGFSLSD